MFKKKRLWEDFDKNLVEPDLVCNNDIDIQDLKKELGGIRGNKV